MIKFDVNSCLDCHYAAWSYKFIGKSIIINEQGIGRCKYNIYQDFMKLPMSFLKIDEIKKLPDTHMKYDGKFYLPIFRYSPHTNCYCWKRKL